MGTEVQHKKIKNTGILFELLTRQLTADIINGNDNSVAKRLIQTHFDKKTELVKEYFLYQTLTNQKFDSDAKASTFIDEVIGLHSKLNKSQLRKEKYNLVKEIKENYKIDDFFKNKIDNYKVLASVYKIFQAKSMGEGVSAADIVNSRYTILEHIIAKPQLDESKTDSEKVIKEYERQNKDLRLLAYKIMTDKFNDKYKNLSERQKKLIKEYINNISSSNSLKKFISEQAEIAKKELSVLVEGFPNKVSQIKITEVMHQLDGFNDKNINDNHVMAMLNVYELIDELKHIKSEPAPKEEKEHAKV